MFQILCPLGHILEIGAEHIGQRLMCPLCQAVVHTSPPPRPWEQPGTKYEVQCPRGHILRVKQKYLGKEIRCPSCQQLVSMKPEQLLTSNGISLGMAKPDAFKKQTKPRQDAPIKRSAKRKFREEPSTPSSVPTKRIPPPPNADKEDDTDDKAPKAPDLAEDEHLEVDDHAIFPKTKSSAAATVPDDDFEFEVVDTQFNMELKKSGIEPTPMKPEQKRVTTKVLPPVPPIQSPPAKPPVPTGLHSLSGSEMMQVNNAALEAGGPPAMSQFNCPNGHFLEVESKYQGMQIQCPMCKVIFTMPPG